MKFTIVFWGRGGGGCKYERYGITLNVIINVKFGHLHDLFQLLGTFRGLRFTAEEPLTHGNIPV